MSNTITITHDSLAVIKELEAIAKQKGATTAVRAMPPAPEKTVVKPGPTVGGKILSLQRTSPITLHVDAPCACSGSYTLDIDGITRGAVGEEGSGLWNITLKRLEPQPFKAGEFVKLSVATTGETSDAIVGAIHLGRNGTGGQCWIIKIENIK